MKPWERYTDSAAITPSGVKLDKKKPWEKYGVDEAQKEVDEIEMPEQPTSKDSSREAFDDLNMIEQGLVGLVKPVRETYLGAKDLLTDLSAEEQNELRTVDEGVHGAPALVGEIISEVGMMAVPGGALTKGAKYAPKLAKALSKAPKAAQLAKDVALTAGMEGLKAPTDDVSRLERAGLGVAGAVGGAGVAKGLGKFFGGAKSSDAAKVIESLSEDIPLTTGQRTTGLFRASEKTLAGSPLTANWTKEVQDKGLARWRTEIVKKVGDDAGISIKSPNSRAGMVELKEGIDAGYKKLWSTDIEVPTDDLLRALSDAEEAAFKKLDRGQLSEVTTLTDNLVDQVIRTRKGLNDPSMNIVEGRTFDDMDSAIQEGIDKAFDAGNARQGALLKELRAGVRENLPPETKMRLRELDGAYQQYSNLQKASTSAHAGDFSGGALEKQIQKGATSPVLAGTAPLQQQAEAAVEVFDHIATSPNPPTLERFMNLLASIPLSIQQNPAVKAIISGKMTVQNKAAALAKIMRENQMSAGRIGGAIGAEDRGGL